MTTITEYVGGTDPFDQMFVEITLFRANAGEVRMFRKENGCYHDLFKEGIGSTQLRHLADLCTRAADRVDAIMNDEQK